MKGVWRSAMVGALLLWSGMAAAVEPGEALQDPALEARARAISAELRCLVCQNESIDDSGAPLAADLRHLVRERLQAGDTDRQTEDYIVARYGEFVLLRPRLKLETMLLWFGPFAAVLAGALGIILYARRRAAAEPPVPLSEEEERRLREIVNG